MSNPFMKKWLSGALCALALGSTAALAEPDSFALGDGHNGARTVTAANTTLNSYAQVTGPLAPGDTSIPVGTCAGDTSCFAAGDLIMVLQTTGLVPEPASGTAGPLSLNDDTNPVGRWEFARLASVTGSALVLTAPLVHSYAANVTQVIKAPEYTDLTITGTGRVTALPWDGSVGGVIAFLANGTVTVNNGGQINAGGAGFRGGQYVDDISGQFACLASEMDQAAPQGAQKGEGVVATRYIPPSPSTGRGNVANGAGGGVCYKAGGGGGGNAGAGGQGGHSEGFVDGSRPVGGLGGAALAYTPARKHLLLMGGGGGAGHGSESTGVPGGRGGGIIFIRANQLSGAANINASGGLGGATGSDGGSGGGAGGSVYLRFVSTAACGQVSASGGIGGNVNADQVGPGGGGGGGWVLFQSAGGTCVPLSNSVAGANPGIQKSGTVAASYGAQTGNGGVLTSLMGGFVVPPVPTVLTPGHGTFTSNPRPVITGTASPSTTVVIYIDGVAVGQATSDAAGNYAFVPTTDLSEGSHLVQAATEIELVQSAKSTGNTFTVDLTPPNTLIVSNPPSTSNSKSATFDFNYEGTESGTVTYQCKLDTEAGFTPCPDPKTYTDLGEGGHTLLVRAVDATGNVDSSPARYDWTVDLTPPETKIVSGPASLTSETSATFDFDVVTPETGVTYECKLDTEADFTPCADPKTYTGLGEGSHTLLVRAVDALGNADLTPASYTWTVDTVAPAAPVVSQTLEGATFDTATPVITGTAEPGSTVTVIIDGVAVGTTQADASGSWSYTPTTPLSEGSHEVKARATDPAGNDGPVSGGRTFSIQDSTRPETTITSGPSGSTPERGATFEFGSNEPGVTYECSLDGAAYTPCTSPVTFNDLAPGEHTLQVRARDAAGNEDTTPDTRTWTVTESTGNGGGDISFRGDGFGCSATGGDSTLVLMGLGTFLAMARRRRRN